MLVSVIIPALNEAKNIGTCVAAARRGYSSEQVEIVVVDGGSTDGTGDLVASDVRLLHSSPGRGKQMNLGARASRGHFLIFCHADSELPEGWREAVLGALSRPRVVGGAFHTRIEPAHSWLLQLWNRARIPSDWRLIYGDEVQFMSWRVFEQVGGFAEMPILEDLEMSRRLAKCGKLVRLPLRVRTSSRRFQECGVLRQTVANLSAVIRYLYLGEHPDKVAAVYRSSRERMQVGRRMPVARPGSQRKAG